MILKFANLDLFGTILLQLYCNPDNSSQRPGFRWRCLVHGWVRARARACVRVRVHACVRAFERASVCACMRACERSSERACARACMRARVREFACCACACMRAYSRLPCFVSLCLVSFCLPAYAFLHFMLKRDGGGMNTRVIYTTC